MPRDQHKGLPSRRSTDFAIGSPKRSVMASSVRVFNRQAFLTGGTEAPPPNIAVQERYNQRMCLSVSNCPIHCVALRPLPCNYNMIPSVSALSGRNLHQRKTPLLHFRLNQHILEKSAISLWLAEVSSDECSGPMNFLPQVAHGAVSVETLTLYPRGLCGSGSIWLPNCTCVEFLSC
jgi:hypothetical protein